MARLYGEKENINSEKIKDFFNDRAQGVSGLSAVFLQDDETSIQRNEEGKRIFKENMDFNNKKVFEIGCGVGRWSDLLYDQCESYLGIDYAEDLIKIAKTSHNYPNCHFQVMSATDINIDELYIKPPFDIIVITGVLMYINDDDLNDIINQINKISSNNKKLFIVEPISCLDTRLTLKDFYSDELKTEYNAVYRTEEEYLDFFNNLNCKNIIVNDMYEDLNHRVETKYKYFILE